MGGDKKGMNRSSWIPVLLVGLLAGAGASASGDERRTADWTHYAPIEIAAVPSRGLVEVDLTPDVLDLARADLADLRVITATGEEAPYVLRLSEGTVRKERLEGRLYNRAYLPRRESSATVDFGRTALKDLVEVHTSGAEFRRKVRVEGSGDGRGWQLIRDGAFVFHVREGVSGAVYENRAIRLPDNDMRYLRITVYNAPDDAERVEIQSVDAWRLVGEPAQTAPVPVLAAEVATDPKERVTDIILDLAHGNLPLHEVSLRFGDADFLRPVTLSGRDHKERVVVTDMEDGPPSKKTVPEPWTTIGGGAIHRFSSGTDRQGVALDESLVLRVSPARFRYLRVRVHDADNPPLRFEGAEVTRLHTYLAFQPKGPAEHQLYVGNPKAGRPSYDLVHYAERLRGEGVAQAVLGLPLPNPERPEGPPIPWSERHKAMIWIALIAVLAVLGLLVYRQARAARAGGPEGTA